MTIEWKISDTTDRSCDYCVLRYGTVEDGNPLVLLAKIYRANDTLCISFTVPDEKHWRRWRQLACDDLNTLSTQFDDMSALWAHIKNKSDKRPQKDQLLHWEWVNVTPVVHRAFWSRAETLAAPKLFTIYFKPENDADNDDLPVAHFGAASNNVFPVEFLTTDTVLRMKLVQQLNYYFGELPSSRRMEDTEQITEYQQYHCTTAANAYGDMHWLYHLTQVQCQKPLGLFKRLKQKLLNQQ
ncbi:MAG: hypothetical protein CL693_11915 [Cellvibrionaceae bacterium]|nr:hypothetical protein [Cellvibrionaceae bacterium]|tara:strand:- start:16213 stop:16932 length:720 start_codon:yes stop_codon:yes gene_type:complete